MNLPITITSQTDTEAEIHSLDEAIAADEIELEAAQNNVRRLEDSLKQLRKAKRKAARRMQVFERARLELTQIEQEEE